MSKFKNNQEFFDFSVNMVVVPIKDIVERMEEHHIKLPLFAYRFLLMETIREEVFEEVRFESYTDELQYRLRNYDTHSIFLLEKLINKYELPFDLPRFKELLFNFLYLNKDNIGINSSFFNQLIQLKDQYELEVERLAYNDFYEIFRPLLFQTVGYIDGIHSKEWDDDTLTSHTLGDLKNLGLKFDIKVPRRINKNRLIEILAAKLQLSDEEVENLSKNSILDIEIYAKEKGFRISTDLKKIDMIEYIKFSLDMYHKDIPSDNFDYNIPIPYVQELEEDIEDDVIEETVTENITPDEVEEEITIEEISTEEDINEELEEEIDDEIMIEEAVIKEIKKDEPIIPVMKEESLPRELADSELLTEEEKELLDEKIAYIIEKYHKKKKRRKIFKIIFFTLLILLIAAFAYGYIHFHYISEGELPFNIPIFWK